MTLRRTEFSTLPKPAAHPIRYDSCVRDTRVVRLLLLFALGAIATGMAAEVSGKWIATVKVKSGSLVDIFLTVDRAGQSVTGTVAYGDQAKAAPIEQPEVRGEDLAFEAHDDTGRPVQFRLRLDGDSLTGQITGEEPVLRVTFRPPPPPGVFRARGGVTPPTLAHKVNPSYTKEARRQKIQGTVLLYIQVDPAGKATKIRVLHSLGSGLDEKAIEAVRKWKFHPGMKAGKPVTVEAQVEVNFRLI